MGSSDDEVDILANCGDDPSMHYPGGKGKCFQRLINLMPPHLTYIESHLGGGAVMRNKRPAFRNIGIDTDSAVIDRWRREYPGRCELVHGDAVAFLQGYQFSGDELVYADPPYLAETRRNIRIYRHEYCFRDHVRLLEILDTLPCRVMISGYDSLLYRERLADWRLVTFAAKTHADVREECVWLNFDAPAALHDASFLGSSFREREAAKRRSSRMIDRFQRMSPIERSHVLRLLNERFGNEQVAR